MLPHLPEMDQSRKLFETGKLSLEHRYETVFLVNKVLNKKYLLGELYGDPRCGLISKENTWAIAGGSGLLIWYKNEVFEIEKEELFAVHGLRQVGPLAVDMLIDPWSSQAAVWRLDLDTREVHFLRAFHYYRDKPYAEDVEW